MSADSGTSDGLGVDKEPNDYASGVGTSFSAPFVVRQCGPLIIEAMQKQGIKWNFGSSDQPRYVKMLLCATASETNAKREGKQFNPTLDRAAAGPEGFPAGKDQQEGYGLINPDAAVEAVCQTYAAGLDGDRRIWAAMPPPSGFGPEPSSLKAGCDIDVSLDNPGRGGFRSLSVQYGPEQHRHPRHSGLQHGGGHRRRRVLPVYARRRIAAALLVVKRVSGNGNLHSELDPGRPADRRGCPGKLRVQCVHDDHAQGDRRRQAEPAGSPELHDSVEARARTAGAYERHRD